MNVFGLTLLFLLVQGGKCVSTLSHHVIIDPFPRTACPEVFHPLNVNILVLVNSVVKKFQN